MDYLGKFTESVSRLYIFYSSDWMKNEPKISWDFDCYWYFL